jgi:hypothetical protein
MRTVVVYDSKFGNTEKIADAIARGVGSLGTVRVMDTAEAVEQPAELNGVRVAAFDIRYRGSTWLMGGERRSSAHVSGWPHLVSRWLRGRPASQSLVDRLAGDNHYRPLVLPARWPVSPLLS